MTGGGGEHPDLEIWRQRVRDWYPEYLRRPYFQPAVFMNRTNHQAFQIAGQNVHITQQPVSNQPRLPKGAARPAVPPLLESDVRDDSAQVKVLRCLQEIPSFDKEVMFVITQMNFGDYLNQPAYAAAVQTLPRPVDLKSKNQHRGDFDVLIIHRQYGILVGEIKAIGDVKLSALSDQDQDKQIVKRIGQALKQLQKDGLVLSHVVSDQATPPRISKTVMLPNITTAQIQSALSSDSQLCSDLRQCLDISVTADPSPLCLTSDSVSSPAQWWQQWMTTAGPDPAMTDQLYLDLISRFCGPASTVKVASVPRLHVDMRTEGQEVAETGWQFTRLVLHPRQLAVLSSTDRLVYLVSPPGCGKSTVLLLKALDWLNRGKHVQVVSLGFHSLPASHLIFSQLQMTAEPADRGRVHLHTFQLYPHTPYLSEYQTAFASAVSALMAYLQNGELFIIADEIGDPDVLKSVYDSLLKSMAIHIWAAGLDFQSRPDMLTEVVLSEPLRTPPSISREVQRSVRIRQYKDIPVYSAVPSPLSCDGFYPRVVIHSGHTHGERHATDGEDCGRQVAAWLHSLHVGGGAQGSASSSSGLRYSDVFLLTDYMAVTDTERGPSGDVTKAASGIVRGLRQAGVPVSVVTTEDEGAVAAVACRAGPDHVTAASFNVVHGLERPVVVYVDEGVSDLHGRSHCISRSTAFLLWVKRG